ncbi:hypothetical protein HG536_0D04980 [Torulaspora globosa]|uniref:Uncharacterized protein n=1 Tax=Torulaspora globosa TaxID=48254 RepID=A0A7G3ZHJ0_9SACH|nr:uncharacterized protein HG536_0D04980 [Torulaspora globosa]QLL32976.1 hypothetical protein HG536_0D04980 [Torulaspora globosa]
MFNCIRRAPYSTGVTQEFLQGILLRAQEATAKKAAPAVKSRKSADKRSQQRAGGNSARRNAQQKSVGTITPRVKPTFNHSIINRQPQFKKKDANSMKSSAAAEDLIEAFESTNDSASRGRSKIRTSASSRRNTPAKKREVPGMVKKTSSANVWAPGTKNIQNQEAYMPQEPTLASLLKFYPGLPNTPASRLINYSLGLMKAADFPLNREANYGVLENVNEPPKNATFSVKTPSFGQYTESMPLTFEKEKMFKNLSVKADPASFDSVVLGIYQQLAPLDAEQFKSVTHDNVKRKELLSNSQIVRQSLQGVNISSERKQAIYQVCSGLAPIAELTQ